MTRNDRAAVLGTHGSAMLVPPAPDGSLAIAADRRQLAGLYARDPVLVSIPLGKRRSVLGTCGPPFLIPPAVDGSIDYVDRPHLAHLYAMGAMYRLPLNVRRETATALEREEVLAARGVVHVLPEQDRDTSLTEPGRRYVVPSHERLETED